MTLVNMKLILATLLAAIGLKTSADLILNNVPSQVTFEGHSGAGNIG